MCRVKSFYIINNYLIIATHVFAYTPILLFSYYSLAINRVTINNTDICNNTNIKKCSWVVLRSCCLPTLNGWHNHNAKMKTWLPDLPWCLLIWWPCHWNRLPHHNTAVPSLASFKWHLKTRLFNMTFNMDAVIHRCS